MGDGYCCGNGRGLLLADGLDLIQCGWENKNRKPSSLTIRTNFKMKKGSYRNSLFNKIG